MGFVYSCMSKHCYGYVAPAFRGFIVPECSVVQHRTWISVFVKYQEDVQGIQLLTLFLSPQIWPCQQQLIQA